MKIKEALNKSFYLNCSTRKVTCIQVLLVVLVLSGSGILSARETQQAGTQATAQSSVLSNSLLLDATVQDGNRVAVGERGYILISREGANWQLVSAPTEATLTTVYFHDGMLGWAAGHDAVILKTMDGGRHWREVYREPDRESPILDIWFADRDYGIAVGAYGLYLVTRDGGEIWSSESLHIGRQDPGQHAQENTAARETAASGEDGSVEFDLHLNAIARSESGTLYLAAESGHLYRSDDQGEHWQELPSPYSGSFFGVLPLNRESVLIFGLRGHIYRSDNKGIIWRRIEINTAKTLTSGIRLQDGDIVITGMGGVVLISEDQGETFTVRELPEKHSYSAAIGVGVEQLILAGDHGIETRYRKDLRITND
jgi:Uncharacterized protein related to plant photosystem II stability/assembly factor